MHPIKSLIGLLLLLPGLCGTQWCRAADFTVLNNGSADYRINEVNDPTLTLFRGQTYTFSITAIGHPFWIKTNAITGTSAAYNIGLTGNGTPNGTLTFAVPLNAPNSLVYICQFHSAMQGALVITNPPPVAALLSNPRLPAVGQFSFDVAGTIGRLHVIEANTNPASGWVAIGSNSAPAGSFTFTDTNAGAFASRLYRVTTK